MSTYGYPIPAGHVTLAKTTYNARNTMGLRLQVEVKPDGEVEFTVQGVPELFALKRGEVLVFDVGVHMLDVSKDIAFSATSHVVQR